LFQHAIRLIDRLGIHLPQSNCLALVKEIDLKKLLRHSIILTSCVAEYYALPSTKTKRTCSFGKGNRFASGIRNDIPPPGAYNPPSDFENKKKGSMFSFGINWGAYSKVYVEGKPNPDLTLPGPGTYKVIPDNFAYQAQKITLKARLKDNSFTLDTDIPGPGAYDLPTTFTKTGKQMNSKFHSSLAASFHPVHSKRFTYSKIIIQHAILLQGREDMIQKIQLTRKEITLFLTTNRHLLVLSVH